MNEELEVLEEEETRDAGTAAAEPVKKTAAPWPWIAIAAIAIAALIFVLVRDNQQTAGGKNEVVGQMDGATITKSDMYEMLVKQLPEGQAASMLDSLMTTKLIGLEADKAKVTATDAEINAEVDKVKKNFPTEEQFNSTLQQYGLTMAVFKEQTASNVKLRKIFEQKIKPTEEKLKKFYGDHKADFGTPEKVQASHILLDTKKDADAVLAELKKGADFAALAKAKSKDTGSKDNGGILPLFGPGDMDPQFETAAFKLNKGEMSGVVQTQDGFHIIKVNDKKAAVTPAYEDVKPEVKDAFLQQEMQAQVPGWLDQKKKEYNYKNLLAPPVNAESPVPTVSSSPSAK